MNSQTKQYMEKCRCRRHFIVNVEKGLAYVLAPRNASSSMKVALEPYMHIMEYNYVGKPTIDKCVVFTTIRNPITRFVSAYGEILRFRKDIPEANKITLGLSFRKESSEAGKLARFIEEVTKIGLYEGHLLPQSWWFDLGVKIKEYLVCEHLEEDVATFAEKYSVDLVWPEKRVNPGVEPELRKTLCGFLFNNEPRLVGMLRDLYEDDFELYLEKAGMPADERPEIM